jgi:hypothetical protein
MILKTSIMAGCVIALVASAADLKPIVEAEEDVYSYTSANNGAGPMWCAGSTCLVRVGDKVFASGLETIPEAKPLNNCRWMLFERKTNGWVRVHVDASGRTREPSPLACFQNGSLFLSANPTLQLTMSRMVVRPGGNSSVFGVTCNRPANADRAVVERRAALLGTFLPEFRGRRREP